MEIIIILLLVVSYIFLIAIVIWLIDSNKQLKNKLDIRNNSLKLWLDEEVSMKRTYSKLSDALVEDRNDYRNNLSSARKKFNRLNKYIKAYIKWRITLDILINKLK